MAYDKSYYEQKLQVVNQRYIKRLEDTIISLTNTLQSFLTDKQVLVEESQEIVAHIKEQEKLAEEKKEEPKPEEKA
ncbi:MAG: hypothetical protein WCV88_06125 [Patescibacteria group bacterium]